MASRDVNDDEVNDNSLSEWFDQRQEEPCNPLGVFSHEQIMTGLANAVNEWKKVTQQRCAPPRPGLFCGFISETSDRFWRVPIVIDYLSLSLVIDRK